MPAARYPTARCPGRWVGPCCPPPLPHTPTRPPTPRRTPHLDTQPHPVPPPHPPATHSRTPTPTLDHAVKHLQQLLRAQLRGTPWRHLLPLLLLGAAPRLTLLRPLGLRLAGPGLRPVGCLQVRLARAHGVGQRPAELLGRPEGQGAAGGVVGRWADEAWALAESHAPFRAFSHAGPTPLPTCASAPPPCPRRRCSASARRPAQGGGGQRGAEPREALVFVCSRATAGAPGPHPGRR
jgi:hypothetical protein